MIIGKEKKWINVKAFAESGIDREGFNKLCVGLSGIDFNKEWKRFKAEAKKLNIEVKDKPVKKKTTKNNQS